MSSTTIAAAPRLNGTEIALPDAPREDDFLEKLLQIRGEVLASKHPRIQLPRKILEQVAPRATQSTPPVISKPTTNGASHGNQHLQLFPPHPESSFQQSQTPNEYSIPAQHALRPASTKSTLSGIDPVLLTKSDHLIRAELQLKRQQIERALKDQIDKKGRVNDHTSVEDRETLFDIDELLAKAYALVPPVSGLHLAGNISENESFDENSYYSSKANSWSDEDVDHKRNAHGTDADEQLTVQSKVSAHETSLITSKSGQYPEPSAKRPGPPVIDLDEEPYEPTDDIEIYEPEPARVPEDQEESDYSPPPAEAGPSESNRGRPRQRGVDAQRGGNGSSRRHSPVGHPLPLQNTRKRRRDERREERREEKRRQQANKQVVRSPEPYIKEEPQSPPSFANYPDAQPNKRRALQPLPHDVEIVSARDERVQPVYYREQDESPRTYRPFEEPSSPTVIRVPQRRLEREDPDLRRVASLQYARRPYSPVTADPYPLVEPRQSRAASHAFVDRPVEAIYRDTSVRPSAVPRYVRERSRSPVHEYVSRPQSPVTMAPAARRIVVDQYGNKYYAAPVEVRASVAPTGRRIETDPYYERAITREPTMRPPPRPDLYEEEDIQRMPPPPPRRYIEASDADLVEARPLRAASHRPIDVQYSGRETVDRRPVIQYEEMGPPREYASRAYSVRPEIVRREVPSEYAPVRHESVQPRYVSMAAPRFREVSVAHAEPYDDRRYAFPTPTHSRLYVEEGAADRPVETAQDPYGGETRRVSYRY